MKDFDPPLKYTINPTGSSDIDKKESDNTNKFTFSIKNTSITSKAITNPFITNCLTESKPVSNPFNMFNTRVQNNKQLEVEDIKESKLTEKVVESNKHSNPELLMLYPKDSSKNANIKEK